MVPGWESMKSFQGPSGQLLPERVLLGQGQAHNHAPLLLASLLCFPSEFPPQPPPYRLISIIPAGQPSSSWI